jgi:hypothetical protein
MKRKYLILLFAFFLFLGLWLFVSSAKDTQASENNNLPEEEGTYDVPGHPKLKLKVFVYHPGKPSTSGKPIPTPTPPTAQTCSLDDPDSTNKDGLTGWHLPSGTHVYRLNKGSVPSTVGATNFSMIAANSFDAWVGTDVGRKVTFIEGSETRVNRATFDNQNIITWGRTSGSALAVNYTWYNQITGEAVENDTIFNSSYPWAWSGGDITCAYIGFYDAQDILTHELGHRMGLDDELSGSYTNNTMYGYGAKEEVKKNTLTTGDISAVNSIYP